MMDQPWKPADATLIIRRLANDSKLKLQWTKHAKDRLSERDLIISDVLYVLKQGIVYEDGEQSTQPGLYKYLIESRAPNSGNRVVRLVVIPDEPRIWIKLVSVMWVDEA